jgi:hypothetical protein
VHRIGRCKGLATVILFGEFFFKRDEVHHLVDGLADRLVNKLPGVHIEQVSVVLGRTLYVLGTEQWDEGILDSFQMMLLISVHEDGYRKVKSRLRSLFFSGFFGFFIRALSDVESCFVAYERIQSSVRVGITRVEALSYAASIVADEYLIAKASSLEDRPHRFHIIQSTKYSVRCTFRSPQSPLARWVRRHRRKER